MKPKLQNLSLTQIGFGASALTETFVDIGKESYSVVEYDDGTIRWFKLGKFTQNGRDRLLHRLDGPAVYNEKNSYTEWWIEGRLHRLDGPAILAPWMEEWYYNNYLHRDDGPAVAYENSYMVWYRHGNIHRIDGPAIDYRNGNYEWYIHNKKYSFNDYLKKIKDRDMATLIALKYSGN